MQLLIIPTLQVRIEENDRVELLISARGADLQGQRVGDFYAGVVWLQLLTHTGHIILRVRILGFTDWLQVADRWRSVRGNHLRETEDEHVETQLLPIQDADLLLDVTLIPQ